MIAMRSIWALLKYPNQRKGRLENDFGDLLQSEERKKRKEKKKMALTPDNDVSGLWLENSGNTCVA